MKRIMPQNFDHMQCACLQQEFLDTRNFQLHVAYVRRHGYSRRPLSTLTPERGMQVERKAHGVLPE